MCGSNFHVEFTSELSMLFEQAQNKQINLSIVYQYIANRKFTIDRQKCTMNTLDTNIRCPEPYFNIHKCYVFVYERIIKSEQVKTKTKRKVCCLFCGRKEWIRNGLWVCWNVNRIQIFHTKVNGILKWHWWQHTSRNKCKMANSRTIYPLTWHYLISVCVCIMYKYSTHRHK